MLPPLVRPMTVASASLLLGPGLTIVRTSPFLTFVPDRLLLVLSLSLSDVFVFEVFFHLFPVAKSSMLSDSLGSEEV